MLRLSILALIVIILPSRTVLVGNAQSKASAANPATASFDSASGTLRSISSKTASLDGIDTNFKPAVITFVITESTKVFAVKQGDSVIVKYQVRGARNVALSIDRVSPSTRKTAPVKPSATETGGTANIHKDQSAPPPSVVTPQASPLYVASDKTDSPPAPVQTATTSDSTPTSGQTAAMSGSTSTPDEFFWTNINSAASDSPPAPTHAAGSNDHQALSISDQLATGIKLTRTTADKTDIITPGDVIVLRKDGLTMCSTVWNLPVVTTYDNGRLHMGAFQSMLLMSNQSGDDPNRPSCQKRTFVAGEKFWVTGIKVNSDGILMDAFSDPYNDVRYHGTIKFPFKRGTRTATPSDIAKTVAEVISIEPYGGSDVLSKEDQSDRYANPAAAPAIAPPPPPADAAPVTIEIGQTKDQVVAEFGQPARSAKIGAKEIYFYKDMKVTFTNGKVSNVE